MTQRRDRKDPARPNRTTVPIRHLLLALVLFLAALAPAAAERAPDDLCTAAVQRASGRLANCLLRADAHLVVSEDMARHQKKLGKCGRTFARGHARILRRFGASACPDDTAGELGDTVVLSTATVTAAVTETAAGSPTRGSGP